MIDPMMDAQAGLQADPIADPTAESQAEVKAEVKKVWEGFKSRIDASKQYKRKLTAGWTSNVDYRRGKIYTSASDEDRVVVNLDWPLTKAKQAALFSQVPKIRLNHSPETLSLPWLFKFEQKLNDTLEEGGIESAMDEVLVDVINAAGFGAVLIAYESISENVDLPLSDSLMGAPPPVDPTGSQAGLPAPITLPRKLDHRYTVSRISPADLLWPVNFGSSDFEKSPWLGRSGKINWSNGVNLFNLNEGEKEKIVGEDRQSLDKISPDSEKDLTQTDDIVSFDEIFYREFEYDPKSNSYSLIHHLVFVQGKNEPVINEPWKGQKLGPQNVLIGAAKYPIQVMTLSYLSDEAIPPSDSAVSRSTVNEINKGRTQMIKQRDRTIPVRWFDVNRIDTAIQQSLMRGEWLSMIPVQGDGSRSIGEVARASMPQEDFTFYQTAKSDMQEVWSIGPNQEGSGQGIDTAGEASIVQSNFQTRIGRERAKVVKFICSIGEVLGGLLCIFEDPSIFGEGFDPIFGKGLSYSILADSTVLLDSNQKLDRLLKFINFTAKSGFVDVEPVLREVAQLSGLDPNVVIKKPEPSMPVEPTISLRLTGVEDLMNPLALAFLMKSGQAPPAQLVEEAKKLIETSVMPPQDTQMPGQPGVVPPQPEGGPGGPVGASGSTPAGPGGPPMPPPSPTLLAPVVPPPVPLINQPGIPPPAVGLAHPNWNLLPHVSKNADEK